MVFRKLFSLLLTSITAGIAAAIVLLLQAGWGILGLILSTAVTMVLGPLLARYRMSIEWVAPEAPIPGRHWGEPEAGLIGDRLYLRDDTPLHSALHEACHYICMDAGRRAGPFLIVPPLINGHEVADMQADRSLVRNLLGQGLDVAAAALPSTAAGSSSLSAAGGADRTSASVISRTVV